MFNENNKFAKLKAIQSSQAKAHNVKNWKYERDGDVMGTIIKFDGFPHPTYGYQDTVIVRLVDTGELVSAILNKWLLEGMSRKQAAVGDLILIQFLGMQASEHFNRYNLEIQKDQPEMF